MQSYITVVDSPVNDNEYIVISKTASVIVVERIDGKWQAKYALVKKPNNRREEYKLPVNFVLPANILEALDLFIAENS
jgi:hypothetical protein